MKIPSLLLLLQLPLICFFVFDEAFFVATDGRKGVFLGGWKPIEDVNDPHVQEIGKFSVSEHNKEAKTNLVFDRVVRGETQVVAGTNYRLVIAAKDGGVTNNYEAVVWEKVWEAFRNLTSFKQV